jgi:hypothetical protein
MDPVTLIVSAVAAGAAAAARETASQAVKDAYTALKEFFQGRYAHIDLRPVEARPASDVRRASLAEDLGETEAAADRGLLAQAQAMLDAVERSDPDAAASVGVNLKEVRAAFLTIDEVSASGPGVIVEKSEFSGGISLGRVTAGRSPKGQGR